jgi:uncharacterized protein (TIGR03437 family)
MEHSRWISRMSRCSAVAGLILALASSYLGAADQPMFSVITIETDNVVTYVGDIVDPSKLALLTSPATPSPTRAFAESITVGDVVSINGRPAKGLWQTRGFSMGYSPTAGPGFAIADAGEGGPGECKWAIFTPDGILVGRFQEGGLGVHQITGGSGIFMGIRGTQTTVQAVQAPRRTSMTEDPSLRRVLGGGTLIHTFHVAASYAPAFLGTDVAPTIYHMDFSPVSPVSPAKAGEVVLGRVMNLGFTTPAVDPGAPFPYSSSYSVVNAPVEVIGDGQPQDASYKIGWPGETNVYRVDFAVPQGSPSGVVQVQLRAAGIVGPPVFVPVK